jgi:hypothetical protein
MSLRYTKRRQRYGGTNSQWHFESVCANAVTIKKPNYLPMKKCIHLATLLLLVITSACNTKKEEKKLEPGKMELDLTSYGIPALITVPDTANGHRLEAKRNEGTGEVEIHLGDAFAIGIQAADSSELMDIKKQKELVANAEPFKLQKFLIDEPETFLYECKIDIPEMEPHYHFFALVKAGKNTYALRDLLDNDSYLNKAAIQQSKDPSKATQIQLDARKKLIEEMLKAARTLQAKQDSNS